MRINKQHIFNYMGAYGFIGSLCGIKERDGIAYNTGKKMTCLRCKKKYKALIKRAR